MPNARKFLFHNSADELQIRVVWRDTRERFHSVIKCKYYFVTKIFSKAVIENRNLEPLWYWGSCNGVTCDGNSRKLLATSSPFEMALLNS